MYGARGWANKYQTRLFLSDTFVVALVMVFAHAARFGRDLWAPVAGAGNQTYAVVTVAIGILWITQLGVTGSREARILGHGPQEFQRVVAAGWWTFAIVAIVGFLTQWSISRGYLLFALPLGTIVLLIYRAVWRTWIHAQRDRGELQAQVLVVGPLLVSEQMVKRLHHARRAGYNVVGICTPPGTTTPAVADIEGVPVLGPLDDGVAQASAAGAEFILLSGNDAMSLREARALGWSLEGSGIGLIVAPSMVDVAGPRVKMSPVEGLPLLHVEAPQFSGPTVALKLLTDRIGAALILAVLAMPLAIIAVLVKLSSPGPVLYRQVRVGLDHQLFEMLKFRSMYVDADARLADLRESSDGNGVLFKMREDPRVTRVGRVLRRYSLDELPQLLNVLKGDMSLVGPRPPLPSETEHWDARVSRRQLVRPGITGLWQVSGRSDLSWDESVRLDLYYTENWSLGGDAMIILRTLWAVIAGRGAY